MQSANRYNERLKDVQHFVDESQETSDERNEVKMTGDGEEPQFGVAYDFNNLPKIVAVHTLDREDERNLNKCTSIEIYTKSLFEKTFINTKQRAFLSSPKTYHQNRNDYDYYNVYGDGYHCCDYDYNDGYDWCDYDYDDGYNTAAKGMEMSRETAQPRPEKVRHSPGNGPAKRRNFKDNRKMVWEKRKNSERKLKAKYESYYAQKYICDEDVIHEGSEPFIYKDKSRYYDIESQRPSFVEVSESFGYRKRRNKQFRSEKLNFSKEDINLDSSIG